MGLAHVGTDIPGARAADVSATAATVDGRLDTLPLLLLLLRWLLAVGSFAVGH